MNLKTLLALLACLLGWILPARGDGFVLITGWDGATEAPAKQPLTPLEVTRHQVSVRIEGPLATTTVEEEFYNPQSRRLEGTYLFPIPKEAHLDQFRMDVNGKMTPAELLPADKARELYESIVRKAKDPALLEYAGRGLFKARIFPIEPHSRKQVKLVYTELLTAEEGTLRYTYPLGTEKFSAKPIPTLGVKVEVLSEEPLTSIYSPSHKIDIQRDGPRKAAIRYEAKNEKPDTDFQLVLAQGKADVGVHVMTCKQGDEPGYFLLLAAPSPAAPEGEPAPKDVVFVFDSSGSMAGTKLKQARKALEYCVESLNPRDRFEILRFSTDAEPLFSKLADANDANRKRAGQFLRGIEARGGTAIANALDAALKLRPEAGARPFVVIFLTDGQPTVGPRAPKEILDRVGKTAGNARIFSFGVGSDVNTHLLDPLAESTRAFSQYVLPEEDIEEKVSRFFTRIKEPALTNLKLEFSGGVTTSQLAPAALPDLYKGDQLVLTGRYQGSGEAKAVLTGEAGGRPQRFEYTVRFADREGGPDFIPALWATRQVGFLLDEIRLHGESPELRDEVAALARRYGIVTPYTAYLILEDEDRRAVPMELRSMQEMNKDRAARAGAASAWAQFKGVATGDAAVANAVSQNVFKQAVQAGYARAEGNRSAMTSLAPSATSAPAFADKAATSRIAQYTQQTKYVNGRAFFQNGAQWVDAKAQALTKRQRVQFNTDAYFALVTRHPEAAPWLALGSNMLLALDDTVYEITD
ncbi:MAG: VIT domain-containing protein [Chthoniobacteraceae bacterium]|nr:VIT domain-containing protein [Chthoniobacteraceae bacterium]